MNIKLANFQLRTIKLLLESMEEKTRDIIFKCKKELIKRNVDFERINNI